MTEYPRTISPTTEDPIRPHQSMATFDITGDVEHAWDQSSPVQTGKKRNRLEKINYPKKRVAVACEICRSRKTRCDASMSFITTMSS